MDYDWHRWLALLHITLCELLSAIDVAERVYRECKQDILNKKKSVQKDKNRLSSELLLNAYTRNAGHLGWDISHIYLSAPINGYKSWNPTLTDENYVCTHIYVWYACVLWLVTGYTMTCLVLSSNFRILNKFWLQQREWMRVLLYSFGILGLDFEPFIPHFISYTINFEYTSIFGKIKSTLPENNSDELFEAFLFPSMQLASRLI